MLLRNVTLPIMTGAVRVSSPAFSLMVWLPVHNSMRRVIITERDHIAGLRQAACHRSQGGRPREAPMRTAPSAGTIIVPGRLGRPGNHRRGGQSRPANCGPSTVTLEQITGKDAISGCAKMIICPYPFCDPDARVASVVRKSPALWESHVGKEGCDVVRLLS